MRKAHFGLLIQAIIMVLAPFFSIGLAFAADTSAPALQSLTVTPSSVDVTTAPATVGVSARLTDATGVSYFLLCINAPDNSGQCIGSRQAESNQCALLVSQKDYTCAATFTINTNAVGGDWNLSLQARDSLGNTVLLDSSQLAAAGFQSSIHVTSSSNDVSSPTLDSFVVAPSSVDVTTAGAVVTMTARLSDATGVADFGMCIVNIQCLGNHQAQSTDCGIVVAVKYYACTMVFTINAHIVGGDYPISGFATDTLGNRIDISSSSLASQGYTSTIHVTSSNTTDTAPPVLSSLTVLPSSVDVTTAPAALTVTAQLSDPSGVRDFVLCLNAPDGSSSQCLGNGQAQTPNCAIVFAQPQYICTMTFILSPNIRGGDWDISGYAYDVFWNRLDFNAASLAAAGFTSTVHVTSNN